MINRFLTGLPSRFEAAKGMPKLHAVVITADTTTGEATAIERISLTRAALEELDVDSSDRRCLRCSTTPSRTIDRPSRSRRRTPAAAPPPVTAPPAPAKPPARTVYTVSELTAAVARRLEKEFFQVWLEGEISNARPAALGPPLLHAEGRHARRSRR